MPKAIALFFIFLGLALVVHETLHLVTARALGYEADIFYGIELGAPIHIIHIYGTTEINSSSLPLTHTMLLFSIGGVGAGLMFLVLWWTIDDIIVKFLLSFFTVTQFAYGALETMYGLGYVERSLLPIVPSLVGLVAMVAFGVYLRKHGALNHKL